MQDLQSVQGSVDDHAASAGPRERRRRATGAALERAAVELALEVGSEHVTVEAICERGLISHRTFYNYFPSKDAALLGAGPTPPSEERLEEFRSSTSEDVVADTVDLLAGPLLELQGDNELFALRHQLLRREPHLVEKAIVSFGEMIDELVEVILARLLTLGRTVQETPDLRDEAAMIASIAAAVMQRAMHERARADANTNTRAILEQSIGLARRVLMRGRK